MAFPSSNFTSNFTPHRPNFLEPFRLARSSGPSLGGELTDTKPRRASWNDLRVDHNTESESEEDISSSDDNEVDEEEVIFALDEDAMAVLPSRLQKNMREIQSERFYRLTRENPNIKIRTDNPFYSPPRPRFQHSTSLPPWLVPPADLEAAMNFRHFESAYPAFSDPTFCRSLNVNSRTRQTWTPTAPCQGNAFGRPRAASAAALYLNHSTQTTPPPQKERTTNRYHQSHRHRYSRFSSLSLRPVASHVRARVKKSFQRLNRLIRR